MVAMCFRLQHLSGSVGGPPSLTSHIRTAKATMCIYDLKPKPRAEEGDRQDLCLCTRPPA